MKLKKITTIMAIALTIAATSTTFGQVVYAAETSNHNQKSVGIEQNINSQYDLGKLDKYVKLNTATTQFELVPSAKTDLNKDELKFVNNCIKNSNNMIRETKKDKKVFISTNNNIIHIKSKANVTTRSINTDSYWDGDTHWWGNSSIFIKVIC